MLLAYASRLVRYRHFGLAVLAGLLSLGFGLLAACCLVHLVKLQEGLEQASKTLCGTCYMSMVKGLGMPMEATLPLGIFLGGCTLVAGIQAIRFANGARKP